MSRIKKILLFILGTIACLIAVSYLVNHFRNFYDGDFFYVEHNEAQMPVWVRGNETSEVFIIHLHGGPGGSGIMTALSGPLQPLEKRYRVVYWDQRTSGLSKGKKQSELLTVEQFVQDTDFIVDEILKKYNASRIFIYGSSWGGTLGIAYLLNAGHQKKIAGFIDHTSGHNQNLALRLSRKFVIDYAKEHKNIEFWNKSLAWYNANDNIGLNNIKYHAFYVSK